MFGVLMLGLSGNLRGVLFRLIRRPLAEALELIGRGSLVVDDCTPLTWLRQLSALIGALCRGRRYLPRKGTEYCLVGYESAAAMVREKQAAVKTSSAINRPFVDSCAAEEGRIAITRTGSIQHGRLPGVSD
jgi:hypothetical protein